MAFKTKYKPSEVVLHNSAKREIDRYRDSPFLWCQHVLGVTLNKHQLVFIEHFKQHANNLLIGSRRIQKSFAVAMWLLMEASTKQRAEVNVHAPALEQSKRNLAYMTERILESEIMMAFIERRLGDGLGKEAISFVNASKIQAKGQASSIDGLGATHQWWEECDDMDWETLMMRILPTGSQIKPGFEYGNVVGCRRVATGTIKGQGNLHRLEHPEVGASVTFNVLPKMDCYDGIAMGIIPEDDILLARDTLMTPAQFARAYLALYTESREYFPSSIIFRAADPSCFPEEPLEGSEFVGGPVTFGMDFEGQGATEEASRTAITFVEQVGPGAFRWLYAKEWEVGTSPGDVRSDVVRLCRFFQPIGGYGDAYGAGDIYDMNIALKKAGVTRVDVRRYKNLAGSEGWDRFFFKPIRFHGPAKHAMYKRMQTKLISGLFSYPLPVSDHPDYRALSRFLAQLENIKAKQAAAGYDSFTMIRKALGDDLVDAGVAALWAAEDAKHSPPAFGGGARSGGFRERKRFVNRSRFKGG